MAIELNMREFAILRAVLGGRAQLRVGCSPDLCVDGGWCDHAAVVQLVRGGLIEGTCLASVGMLIPARLTELGHSALDPANVAQRA